MKHSVQLGYGFVMVAAPMCRELQPNCSFSFHHELCSPNFYTFYLRLLCSSISVVFINWLLPCEGVMAKMSTKSPKNQCDSESQVVILI